MRTVGIIDNTAYFGFLYGGPVENPYLHLFSFKLENMWYQETYIDFTSAVYEYFPTKGDFTFDDEKALFILVCQVHTCKRMFIYTRTIGNNKTEFYLLNYENSEWVSKTSTFCSYTPFTDVIPWNRPTGYIKLERLNGKIIFKLK